MLTPKLNIETSETHAQMETVTVKSSRLKRIFVGNEVTEHQTNSPLCVTVTLTCRTD